jgi:hypothetical protein
MSLINKRSVGVLAWILVTFAFASIACRLSGEPDQTVSVEQEQTPVIATEAVSETQPEATEIVVEPTETEVAAEPAEPQENEAEPLQVFDADLDTEPVLYQVGDLIAIQDQIMMVLGWEIIPGDKFFTPDLGTLFMAVDLILVNTGSEPIIISTLLQTVLTGMQAGELEEFSWSLKAQANTKGGLIDGYLLPGERVRGKISFQVPEEVEDLVFTYTPVFLQKEQVTIGLGPDPVRVSPPAALPGERELVTYPLNEAVEINGLTLTVNQVFEPDASTIFKPSDGYKFIVVDLTVINQGETPINISTQNNLIIRDKTGLSYSMDTSATALAGVSSLPDGEYAPGETIEIILGYEVPAEEMVLYLVFDGTEWELGKFNIELPLE